MSLDILTNGIVHRREDTVTILRPSRYGAPGVEVEVPTALAEEFALASGDVVRGRTEPLADPAHASVELREDERLADEERDEPGVVRGDRVPDWLTTRIVPTERLVTIETVNGLGSAGALERPSARFKRSGFERQTPHRHLALDVGVGETGMMLDFAAPLGEGCAGIICGPHGAGLTRTLRAVVEGVRRNASDLVVMVMLLRARGEEMTDWRRRFPDVDVVVCPSGHTGAPPDQTLRTAELVLECAQRQTELGRSVLLAVDSLTGLWGVMLEEENADAQREADYSIARQRVRDWVQRAGDFRAEGPLGPGLGGTLTLVGTVWQRAIDVEAEEEGEIHPHLRLLEHILHETSWRVSLSGELSGQRLFPAIDTAKCTSRYEAELLPQADLERLYAARRSLLDLSVTERYQRLIAALDESRTVLDIADRLATGGEDPLARARRLLDF